MKNKKNIDKLFTEGFKNFEATPSPRVWENIQADLKKERNRRPIPLWATYGGVAALLAVFFTVGSLFFNPGEPDSNSITNTDIVAPIQETVEHGNNQYLESEPQLATEQESIGNQSLEEETTSTETSITRQINSEAVVKSSESLVSSREDVSSASEVNGNQNKALFEESEQNDHYNQRVTVSKIDSQLPKGNAEDSDDRQNKTEQISRVNKLSKNTAERIADINTSKESKEISENLAEPEIAEDSDNKKSILDAIAENETLKEEKSTEKPKREHRWNIAPNVAPVYYSSFGNGSSIDADFANNPQKGEVNMSYGLQVSYALSERLSVRSGINNVDLGYSTSGIVIGTGPVAMGLRSVDYGSQEIVVLALNRNTLTDGFPAPGNFGEITLKSTDGDARLIQNINYYEVPLELKYSVVNTRLGVNIIGGVSTLFLGDNEISVASGTFSSVLGEANNLSSVSFSTNIGLGLDYKLSRRFVFNIEPMFKYQLNPYTDSTVNFKPYYLGVYSGLSFKF